MPDTLAYTQPPAQQVPPPLALLEILNGMWVARAVQVAAELGLADELTGGPLAPTELARRSGTDPDALTRLLSALASVGIFAEDAAGRIEQTTRSACLASDHPASMRNAARMFGADWQWRAWTALPDAVRTGQPAFDATHGTGLLDYLRSVDPDAGALFDAAMLDLSGFLNRAVLAAWPLEDGVRIIDVGGGHSTLLGDLLQTNQTAEGTLVDVPAVAAVARERLDRAGIGDRARVVESELGADLPEGADLLVLNRVLHDWDDERALAILRACRRAAGPSTQLLVIEQLLDGGRRGAFLDLQMLVIRGGRERSVEEYGELLAKAGFSLERNVQTFSPMTLLVAHPD